MCEADLMSNESGSHLYRHAKVERLDIPVSYQMSYYNR
ncbi:hypothetical protein EDB47_1422 [Vibrio crassostreae]|nr:hypothetical protein EDB44_13813 [Vibrio crassostreae]TCT75217.1 hypothetical protein EDB43_13813 [Vibrio crassostreae]TCT95681.1 hypothetical protein EDB47_1422 [Vibrio crassostreae]